MIVRRSICVTLRQRSDKFIYWKGQLFDLNMRGKSIQLELMKIRKLQNVRDVWDQQAFLVGVAAVF